MALNKLDFIRVNVACDWICLTMFTESLLCQIENRIQPSYVGCTRKWNCTTAFAVNLLRKIKKKKQPNRWECNRFCSFVDGQTWPPNRAFLVYFVTKVSPLMLRTSTFTSNRFHVSFDKVTVCLPCKKLPVKLWSAYINYNVHNHISLRAQARLSFLRSNINITNHVSVVWQANIIFTRHSTAYFVGLLFILRLFLGQTIVNFPYHSAAIWLCFVVL